MPGACIVVGEGSVRAVAVVIDVVGDVVHVQPLPGSLEANLHRLTHDPGRVLTLLIRTHVSERLDPPGATLIRAKRVARCGTFVARGRQDPPAAAPHTPADQHFSSGRRRHRSVDPALFRRVLYRLSYPTAVLTGFEPAASGLTGRRALQTAPQDPFFWHPQRDSNPCCRLERAVS